MSQSHLFCHLPISTVDYLLLENGYPLWFLKLSFGTGVMFSILMSPVSFATQLAMDSLVTHSDFDRPNSVLPEQLDGPKVSVHVPVSCCKILL